MTKLLDLYRLYMTIEDLANVTHSSKQTIYNKIYDGSLGIPYWRLGKKYLFSIEAVSEHVERQLELSVQHKKINEE